MFVDFRYNLDLGKTIWRNPSRKLLSFHRYFFTSWNKLPRRVQREFEHHSHTHPNTAAFSSSSNTHTVTATISMMWCGNALDPDQNQHNHFHSGLAGGSHQHVACVISFGWSDLGVPWDNHTHSASVTSMDSVGASHSHGGWNVNSSPNGCFYIGAGGSCRSTANKHYHASSGLSDAANTFAHSHTGSGTTSTATGTAPAHTHTISMTFDVAGSHTHPISGSSLAAVCKYSMNHPHSMPATATGATHGHTSGTQTSGSGGETPVVGGVFAQVI